MEVSKSLIHIAGAVIILLLIFLFLAKPTLDILQKLFYGAENIMLKEIEITSAEQFEQLMKCMRQRAYGCDKVEKGSFNLLKNVENFENCACGGNFMAGTDIGIKLNFMKEDKVEIKDGFAGFEKVELSNNRCFAKVQQRFTGKSNKILIYGPSNVIKNGSKMLAVVNRCEAVDITCPWSETGYFIEGCIELLN